MEKKALVSAITLSLLFSGTLVAVGGERVDVKEINEIQGTQEIYDWYDLDSVRDDLRGDYVLMNDLDENTAGYEEYNAKTVDYEAREDAGYEETWGVEDTIEIHFEEGDYDSVLSVEDEDGDLVSHTVDHPTITIDEDTGERFIWITYENALVGWNPIGDHDNRFTGTFDGNGHEINHLYIERPDTTRMGLFGCIDDGAEIIDIGLVDADIRGGRFVGGLVGLNFNGSVINSYSIGEVNGVDRIGGLVGHNRRGTVENTYAIVNLTAEGFYGGGIIGSNRATVDNSYAEGEVIGLNYVGGLLGSNIGGDVSNSYATNSVSGNNSVGGLMGWNTATVENSYATGDVSGNEYVGGLVGSNSGTVENSYSTGDVSGEERVGGLVGHNWRELGSVGMVENSHYNIEEVEINGENYLTLGGLFEEQFEDWIDDKKLDIDDYSDTLIPSDDSYEIKDVQGIKDLLGFAWKEEYEFRLSEDIDLSDEANLYIPNLQADFDGNDHTISNLKIDLPFTTKVGMFGQLDEGAEISNVSVIDAEVSAHQVVGGLVGWNDGTVFGSYATGTVSGDEIIVGGLIGMNSQGTIKDSHFSGKVSGESNVGGLVGMNRDTVKNSYSTGDVSGDSSVGGLVGDNRDTVENSYSTGNVSGDSRVGGLVGWNWETLKNSYSTGEVSGEDSVGGLVGRNTGTVENSYWDVDTSGQEGREEIDGGEGLTTEEMTGTDAEDSMDGFDFGNTWETVEEDEDDVDEDGYPILQELDREEQLKAQDVYAEEEDEAPGFTVALLLLGIVILVIIYWRKEEQN